uniref:Protein-S-isoprenylcysteine O-methyltransferase n=1 Tax=Arabidopsis thaliana TaxID=3702 RepID=Q8LAG2_ARATH|nr:unknown [Arabidopsis thaliana]
MEAVLLCSKLVPRAASLEGNQKFSFRHLNKHLKCNSLRADSRDTPLLRGFEAIKSPSIWSCAPFPVRKGSWVPPRCSISSSTVSDSDNPFLSQFRTFSFGSMVKKVRELKVKPMDVVKLTLLLSILTVAAKKTLTLVLDPFFWMYFSWTWLFWPWFIAVGLAGYGIYYFRKHWLGEANAFEQLGIVTSVFTWLTLVPPAYFNGYLEGWPYVFFLAYHYFFFFNVSVRKRLYGDYYARTHDPKWDVNTPLWSRILFGVGIMVGHWLAAFEGPELHRLPGGWANVGIWILIVITMLMHYDSTLYLARYSEKVVVPTAVVQFGPYRWVRHPIYASTMLLFAAYCTALRAPLSLLFLLAVCLVYYNKKAKMEEELMVESFGQSYSDYADKVRHKFIPFVY